MTPSRDDVIQMARQAGIEVHPRKNEARIGMDALLGIDSTDKLERFAALVAESAAVAEREACAKSCHDLMDEFDYHAQSGDLDEAGRMRREGAAAGAMACEAAIRARSTKP